MANQRFLCLGAFLCLFAACATTKPDPDFILVRPMHQRGFTSLEASPSKAETERFKAAGQVVPSRKIYQPNYPGAFGLGIGAYGLAASYSKGFRPEDDQRAEKGATDAHDLQLHFTWGSLGVDVAQQSFKGFYEDVDGAGTYVIHPDLAMKRSAANLFFVSDTEAFAFDAAFGQAGYSDKSGWSFLAMLSYDVSELDRIPTTLTSDLSSAPTTVNLRKLETQTVGVLAGIGLRGITTGLGPLNGIFGSIAVLAGPALQKGTWHFDDGSSREVTDKQVVKTSARFSLGVDKGGWFAGGGFWGDSSSAPGETVDLKLSSNQIESFCGMRF